MPEISGRRAEIQNIRILAIRNAISNGIKSDRKLTQIANKAEEDFTDNMGLKSEKRFDEYAKLVPIIKSVSKTPLLEDSMLGIDRWVTFDQKFHLPVLPLQIKSSQSSVETFKNGDPEKNILPDISYTRLLGCMIVIDTGPSITFINFQVELRHEINRIKSLLEDNRTLHNLFLTKR